MKWRGEPVKDLWLLVVSGRSYHTEKHATKIVKVYNSDEGRPAILKVEAHGAYCL